MNYIDQELSRQKTLLAAILGGAAVKSAAEDDPGNADADAETKAPQQTLLTKTRAGAKSEETEQAAVVSRAADAGDETAADSSFHARFPLAGAAFAARAGGFSTLAEYGENATAEIFAAARPVSQTASGLTAREVSRAVERDARRYDGDSGLT